MMTSNGRAGDRENKQAKAKLRKLGARHHRADYKIQ
jgi:hypothetical protein